MEMERINDDTIRVLIGNQDLRDRGMTVMDLMSNQERIESFFHSILAEVDESHDFDESGQVTFQVLPNRNGLELFISKADPSEQLGNLLKHLTDEQSEEAVSDAQIDALQQTDDDEFVKQPKAKRASAAVMPAETHFTVMFHDFEGLIDLAGVAILREADATVYRYAKHYFVQLRFDEELSNEMQKNLLAIALEYGTLSAVAPEVLQEHGDIIFARDALNQINDLF